MASTEQNRFSNPLVIILGLSFVFFILFLSVTGYLYFSKGSSPQKSAAAPIFNGKGAVGVIEVNGPIMDSKRLLKRFAKLDENPEVKAIVVRLNSPGGAVSPSQEVYEAIKASKKPIVASMSSVAASGAYYIACAAKKVYANPGTITGSIGVIMEFANLKKLYEWAKVERFSIKTGKFKDSGAEYRDMAPEERDLLQGMVNDVLLQFKTAVSTGRKMSMAEVDLVADGRIFSGAQAKTAKLVDELGTFNDAINDAAKMAGIDGKPQVIYPEKKRRGSQFLEFLLDEGKGHDDDDLDSEASLGGVRGLLVRLLGGGADDNESGAGAVSSGSIASAMLGTFPAGVYWIWPGAR